MELNETRSLASSHEKTQDRRTPTYLQYLNTAACGFSLPRGATLATAILLVLTAWLPTVGATNSSNCSDCTPLPPVEVPGDPVDRDEWVPWDLSEPLFPDPGFNDNDYADHGYGDGHALVQCSAWEQQNLLPDYCDPDTPPPRVGPSDPACGPDGSPFSMIIPQHFFSACLVHDVCYSQLESTKDQCDSSFYWNMIITCQQQNPLFWTYTDPGYALCVSQAELFLGGVSLPWAQQRFDALQFEATCRQWHLRRAEETDCPGALWVEP